MATIPSNANKLVSTKDNNYFLENKITLGEEIPTTGTYKMGDIIINPWSVGAEIGWICTDNGEPGEWAQIINGKPDTDVNIPWKNVYQKPSTYAPIIGNTETTAFRGDYGEIAYEHSQAAHAPVNAQKNSDITKAEIEAKLTGVITTHTHNYAGSSTAGGAATSANKLSNSKKIGFASFDGTTDIPVHLILGEINTSSSGSTNKNKWTKFATINVSGTSYKTCTGKFMLDAAETYNCSGILFFYFRLLNNKTDTNVILRWLALDNDAYANSIAAVKKSAGVYDLYFKPLSDWNTMHITTYSNKSEYITLYSQQEFVASITPETTSTFPVSLPIPIPESGSYWKGFAKVNTDGVTEVGKYIDFHNTNTETTDYSIRLQCDATGPCTVKLPSTSGTLARTEDITSAIGNINTILSDIVGS